jgi:hypothetical protein
LPMPTVTRSVRATPALPWDEPREEPDARKTHVRICEVGGSNLCPYSTV